MRKVIITMVAILWLQVVSAQPRPYEIDSSFIPSIEYMQKSWTGEYDGLEPNSRMIMSIKRTLVLNTDLTYSNEVWGQVKNESEVVLLKDEAGTYIYDSETQLVTYSIETDSTLDINNYLQGIDVDYAVNHYKQDGLEKTWTEKAQFTKAANDAARQWVMFDQQLLSPIDQRQKAVYVMTGIETSGILPTYQELYNNDVYYDMNGCKTNRPSHGVYIIGGKKIIVKDYNN